MNKWEEWRTLLANGPEDLKSEVVIADLLLSGALKEDEFYIRNNGGFHRAVARDIENVFPPGTLDQAMEYGAVELNRQGLYDTLPEALFHQSRNTRPFQAVQEMVEEVQRNDEVERKARLFYWPFDHELNRVRVSTELNERRLTQDLLADASGRGVMRFWEIPGFFNAEERSYLLSIMPLCHWLVGNGPMVAQCLSDVLRVPVRLEHAYRDLVVEPPDGTGSLAGCQLGVDSLLAGTSIFHDRVIEVVLGPMERDAANGFAPGCSGRAKLDHLLDLLFPADARIELRIEPGDGAKGVWTQLDGGLTTRLGMASILN